MGRKRINDEATIIRLPAGTIERITALLHHGEKRSDFLRAAVERELKRRARQQRQHQQPAPAI
jgi:hypothetical protein